MNTISIQDIINGEFNYSSLPVISYGQYGIDYVDAVGVGKDKNIYLARTYEELVSMLQNDSFIVFSVNGVSMTKVLIEALKFLSIVGRAEETAKVYVKNDEGYVLPVQEIIDDRDSERIVFVTQDQIVDRYV